MSVPCRSAVTVGLYVLVLFLLVCHERRTRFTRRCSKSTKGKSSLAADTNYANNIDSPVESKEHARIVLFRRDQSHSAPCSSESSTKSAESNTA
jgi:hypothetical protein